MDCVKMDVVGVTLPLWAFFLIGILAIIVVWKLIKFAIKILLIIIVFFLILFGLDLIGVFDKIQGIMTTII